MRIEELINDHYQELSENDLIIWQYIEQHKEECRNLAINELAQRCHVSKTTILRFAQKLSLKGYSELKAHLNWEKRELQQETFEENIVEKICDVNKHSIDKIKKRDFSAVCKMLHEAEHIYVYGTGALQQSIANELHRMFLYCGKLIYVLNGELETQMILPYLTPNDLVILISLRGESEGINTFANLLMVHQIPTLSMTRMKNNTLAHKCTTSLYIETSKIMKGNHIFHEAANLFFILVEVLFLRYVQYVEKIQK